MGSKKQGIKPWREAKASFRTRAVMHQEQEKAESMRRRKAVWEKRNRQIICCVLSDWKKYHWANDRAVEVFGGKSNSGYTENQTNENNGGNS